MQNSDFCTQLMNKHFKLSQTGVVKLSSKLYFVSTECHKDRAQWPHSLRHRPVATRLLGLWVRIPQGTWMSVSCECCVLSGRGLCDGLITCPEECHRVWCVCARYQSLDNEEV